MTVGERFVYKIVLAGPSGVGKTCLSNRFVDGIFTARTKRTLGVDFALKNVTLSADDPDNPSPFERQITLQLWDFAGEERFRSVLPLYISGTQCVMLSFDLTRPETLEALEDWLEVLSRHLDTGTPVLLIGMKQDLEQKVSEDAVKNFQSKHDVEHYLKTSSASGLGVEDAFQKATREIVSRKSANRPIKEA
ncbi:MAG: Rab family GTPase [Candidatus Heimdallarchaeota archaeon]